VYALECSHVKAWRDISDVVSLVGKPETSGRTTSRVPAQKEYAHGNGTRSDRTPAERWAEVKDEEALWRDLRPELLAAVHPRLVRGLERDLDSLLAVFSVPEPLRASLRTTNLLERAFRALRRRLLPIGALADCRSADRILYGGLLRLNELLAARPLVAFTQES
jgi:hypothetical protein